MKMQHKAHTHHKYDFRNAEAEIGARNNFYCCPQAKATDIGHRYFQGKKDGGQMPLCSLSLWLSSSWYPRPSKDNEVGCKGQHSGERPRVNCRGK